MGDKIKKFSLNFKKVNKPAVLVTVFSLTFLGLVLPFQFVEAGFLDVLASIPVGIVTVILQIFLAVSNLIFSLAGAILGWVVGPHFTTLPYTHGGIVDVGWPIVRDFINMFFVIALVVIGLATSLRIKEYQFQKTLPVLILIAILINFTPVICGLIVDASNIVMNFFLEELTGFQLFKNSFAMQGSIIRDLFVHIGDLRYATSALGKTVVMITFNLVATYIFLLFSLLFVMRYVMIWTLVIVSPIAFFSRIFPGSQRSLFKSILGWEEWWKQFIEWSLVGVIAGFFLYLGEQLMMKAPGMISGLPPNQAGIDNPIVDFVNNFLPWMVVLVFLWLGHKITKETSAIGAQGAIKAVDTGIKLVATSAIAAATMGAGAGLLAGGLGKAAAGATRAEAFLGKRGLTKPLQYLVGKPAKWATRGVEMAAAPKLIEYAAKKRRVSTPAGWKQMSITEKEQYIDALPIDSNKLVLASEMKGEGTFQKASQAFQDKMKGLADRFKGDDHYKKEVGDILDALPDKVTKDISLKFKLAGVTDKNEVTRITNDFQNDIDDVLNEFGYTKTPDNEDKAAAILHSRSLKPRDIAEVAKGSLTSENFQLAMQKMSSAHLQSLQNNFDEKTVRSVLDQGKGLNTLSDTEVMAIRNIKNKRLYRWSTETPAGKEMLNWSQKNLGPAPQTPPPTPPTPPTPPSPPSPSTPPPPPPPRGRKGIGGGSTPPRGRGGP